MKYFIIFLILIGFSGTAFAQYMGNISNQTLEYTSPIIRLTEENIIPPPLKQFKSGILYGDIQCKDGLGLVVKTTNRHFACVKPESISKLFGRGWTSNVNLGGESSRHCYQEPEHGICNASREKYYFDWETRSCKSFTWGGCGGSVPFDTLQSCKSLCN